jgi:glutamate formiminotransferase
MIECVPNFSEGRDAATVGAIVEAIASAPGLLVLGSESDQDHNRSVVTFAGPARAVIEGAVLGAGMAAERIRLDSHQGVHPRVGAADVIPFVPLEGSTMEDCVAAAHRAGEEIWRRYGVPVYFYEAAARRAERARLEKVRRPGFDGAPPDVGDIAAHPTAGASCVGARGFLIAYNVDLAGADAAVARSIARRIRESSGGFRFVKAMGLYLESRGCAQVSMNLTNFAETPLDEVYEAIRAEAVAQGTHLLGGELIGLVPRRAYQAAPRFFEKDAKFSSARIIEERVRQLGGLSW